MGMDKGGQTIADLCGQYGRTIEAARKQWSRTIGGQFSRTYVPTEAEIFVIFGKGQKPKQEEKPEPAKAPTPKLIQKQEPKPIRLNKPLLWVCLSLSLGCSVPNMFDVMFAIKESAWRAGIVTASLTISPFLLIGARVGKLANVAAYLVIGFEVFCNAAGFYGGMTGLNKGLFVAPSKFLHMVTSMVNKPYEGTALVLSLFMAACIAVLAAVPVYNLRK